MLWPVWRRFSPEQRSRRCWPRYVATPPCSTPPAPEETTFGLPAGMTEDKLLSEVFLGSEAALIADMLPFLDAGGKNDGKAADKLRALDMARADLSLLPHLEGIFLTGATAKEPFAAKIGSFPSKDTRIAMDALIDPLNHFMARIEQARPLRLGLAALHRARVLHAFAQPFLAAYRAQKDARAWLDFDDLILRTGQIADRSFGRAMGSVQLDGGVDHILVDEAQDTSPRAMAGH